MPWKGRNSSAETHPIRRNSSRVGLCGSPKLIPGRALRVVGLCGSPKLIPSAEAHPGSGSGMIGGSLVTPGAKAGAGILSRLFGWLFGRGGAKALPMLTKGPGGKMLGEAVGHLRGIPGAERAAAFEKFAEQITKATNGQWSAKAFNATNARVFAGEGGEALVFDGAGNMFRGNLSDRAAFAFREGGQIEVIFNALKGL
jgi:hypothetical protein